MKLFVALLLCISLCLSGCDGIDAPASASQSSQVSKAEDRKGMVLFGMIEEALSRK